MSTSSTPNFSSIITALRFPLILFVVAIHLVGEDLRLPQWGTSDWFYLYTTEFISHSLARIAVPMFFFISGLEPTLGMDCRTEEASKDTTCTLSPLE